MEKRWREWARKKDFEKWFRKENLIVLILSGVLLFIIALPTKSGEENGQTGRSQADGGKNTGEAGLFSLENSDDSNSEKSERAEYELGNEEAYVSGLEEKLTENLSAMADVGKVRVMITLKSSGERIVEKEQPVNRSATNESDAQGGSRIVNQVETGETTVYRTTGSDSEPYIVKTLNPEIEGVLVVAEGAGSGSVNKTITEIVQALFGVEAHKVKVVKMVTENR